MMVLCDTEIIIITGHLVILSAAVLVTPSDQPKPDHNII